MAATEAPEHVAGDEADGMLAPDAAAEYLGVTKEQMSRLLERYGIGRYYLPREGQQFVYARRDLDRVKAAAQALSGRSPEARPKE